MPHGARITANEGDQILVPTRGEQGAVTGRLGSSESELSATPRGVNMPHEIHEAVRPSRRDFRRRAHLTPALVEQFEIRWIIVLDRLEQSVRAMSRAWSSLAGACAITGTSASTAARATLPSAPDELSTCSSAGDSFTRNLHSAVRSMQRIMASDGVDLRECLCNALAGQPTRAPIEAPATEALGEGPVGRLAHQVTGHQVIG
jgi:hypothetical protein